MVAKPTGDMPAAAPEETRIAGESIPPPLRLEFGLALEALAEAGYAGCGLDEWLVQFNQANREAVGKLELTAEGVLLVSPMQSKTGSLLEGKVYGELYVWARERGGEAHGSRLGVHLPNGARYAPDAAWLSPEQLADYSPSRDTWLLHFCPHFVAEVMSRHDRPAEARRKMDDYIAHGARLGWLIDPFRRQVHIYLPDAEPLVLDDPEVVSGDPELPGFVFNIRALVFDAQ
jgi:Uma2 family endonuclease